MSYHAWVTKYGKDTSLIGAAIQINSKPFTVIRIAAPGFFGANMGAGTIPDFWMPLSQEPVLEGETSRLAARLFRPPIAMAERPQGDRGDRVKEGQATGWEPDG